MSLQNDAEPIPQKPKPKNSKLPWIAAILVVVAIIVWATKFGGGQGYHDGGVRMQAANNLSQIGKGLHNYDSAFDSLPGRAISDKDGKPLLSWRVAILPFIEQDNIYNQFKLDEPWDSEHNKSLITKMPKPYEHPRRGGREQGLTYYKAPSGRNTVFDNPVLKDKCWLNRWSIAELGKSPRGLGNLILCFESGDPVIWSKPEDWEYDPNQPLPDFKPQWKQGFLALMGDGRVVTVSKDFKESAMRASIDPNSTSKETLDQ